MDVMNMSILKNLDLTVSQTKDNVGLTNMLDSKNLDLKVNQA